MYYLKKYKESFEKAKNLYQDENTSSDIEICLEHIFPELKELKEKESDDEKIRKSLIDYFKAFDKKISSEAFKEFYIITGISAKETIDWLEKQDNKHIKELVEKNIQEINGAIVREDFNGGDGFYKINLAYLNKEQVKQVESLVKSWQNENNIKACIEMILTDASEQRFKDYHITLKDCINWIEKQKIGENLKIKWHDVSESPEEMRELFCKWQTDGDPWHDVAFYHKSSNDFWCGRNKLEGVIKWIYVDDLLFYLKQH